MTQLENAKKGIITGEMRTVAAQEHVDVQKLMKDIAKGYTIITKSSLHACHPVGIGKDLGIKINANIGTSKQCATLEVEFKKLEAAVKYGADTIMDLSTGGDLNIIRKEIIHRSPVPVGTVPIYQAISEKSDVADVSEKDFLDAIERHIKDGVDFITVHCGLKRDFIPFLATRIMGVVSRGGSYLVKWMMHHKKENPLYTHFDDILAMAREYDVSLSLGDGLRPGCLADATDKAQLAELKVLGELCKRSREATVQVMIEGPGHVPLHQIKENIEIQKKECDGAPFYVLGPLVTDIAPGYDHIAGAIGGALAAFYGADFLCYLTPTEHLGLPGIEHVVDGVIASKIAAHAADIGRNIPGSREPDDKMAKVRSDLNWDEMFSLAMNREKAESLQKESGLSGSDVCTMCGDLCSAKINKESRSEYRGEE